MSWKVIEGSGSWTNLKVMQLLLLGENDVNQNRPQILYFMSQSRFKLRTSSIKV
jgi:hypothetical protein